MYFGIFSTNPRLCNEPYFFSSDYVRKYAVYDTHEEAQAICDKWNKMQKEWRAEHPRALGLDYPYVVKPWRGSKLPKE